MSTTTTTTTTTADALLFQSFSQIFGINQFSDNVIDCIGESIDFAGVVVEGGEVAFAVNDGMPCGAPKWNRFRVIHDIPDFCVQMANIFTFEIGPSVE